MSGKDTHRGGSDRPKLAGTTRYEIHTRLGKNWRDLATVLEIPDHEQRRFEPGEEGYAILSWLENHDRLGRLPEALQTIGRGELCQWIPGFRAAEVFPAPSPVIPARQAYLAQLADKFLQHAHLYAPLAGDAAVKPRRKKRLPSAAPSPLFQHFSDRLTEDCQQPAAENHEYDDVIAAFDELQRAVLIGEPGAGKTTALFKLAQNLAALAERDPNAPVPLLIPLREWLAPEQDLSAFMAGHMGELSAQLHELLQQNRLILLLDGLNEIPTTQQNAKAAQIAKLIREYPVRLIASCREQDYRDDLKLDLDTLAIRPLSPSRILDFIRRYLTEAHEGDEQAGSDDADKLFWRLAGGDDVRETWNAWHHAGASDLDYFWSVDDIPKENPAIYSQTSSEQDRIWHTKVKDPRSLIKLAANPFLLWMMINLYWELDDIPPNRASLLSTFTRLLLVREGLADRESYTPTAAGEQLLQLLAQLAWAMQMGGRDDFGGDVDVTILLADAMPIMTPQQLQQAASASFIELGAQLRFSHQLLQEYFVALGLQKRLDAGTLNATKLWPPERWWERSGWEEATVLLAGLYKADCTSVIAWLRDAQPEVAAQCINHSGAGVSRKTLQSLRDAWLPRLTDIDNEPDPRARAAIGRALGSLSVDRTPLDDRKGVWGAYFTETQQAVVNIDWVEIRGGKFIYQDNQKRKLDTFYIARYPVTHSQFQAFIDDAGGYARKDWWDGIPRPAHPEPARWQFHNHPRETVNWFEAIAFCRWLSALLDSTVTLPTEEQWERAARGNKGRQYPWGNNYQSGYANIDETWGSAGDYYLQQTSSVGLYPQGASPEGILDLAGNVWEWCLNQYEKPSITTIDDLGSARVLRGGSWDLGQDDARAASRGNLVPGIRLYLIGFRLCSSSPII